MGQVVGTGDRVLLVVREAISETLGLLEDDAWITPDATLDEDLGITAFELHPILSRIESKLGIVMGSEQISRQVEQLEASHLTHSFTVRGLMAAAMAGIQSPRS